MPDQLMDCPVCKKPARIGYACGDYFVYCSDSCLSPMCDHPAQATTMNHWNTWNIYMRKHPIRVILLRIKSKIRKSSLYLSRRFHLKKYQKKIRSKMREWRI